MVPYLQHGEHVVVPETPVRGINLWDIAEEFLRVDLTQDQTVLQVA